METDPLQFYLNGRIYSLCKSKDKIVLSHFFGQFCPYFYMKIRNNDVQLERSVNSIKYEAYFERIIIQKGMLLFTLLYYTYFILVDVTCFKLLPNVSHFKKKKNVIFFFFNFKEIIDLL
jgi:hypothetical protein